MPADCRDFPSFRMKSFAFLKKICGGSRKLAIEIFRYFKKLLSIHLDFYKTVALVLRFFLGMIEVRFHGRGGQGAKIASRILSRGGFLAGLYVQDLALFGAERRGAPVVSCTRLSEEPIDRRGYVDSPNLVVVMDDSLLKEARAQVFEGVHAATPLFINGVVGDPHVEALKLPAANLFFIDLSGIARRLLGRVFVSAAAAAVAAKCVGMVPLETLIEAVRIEIAEFGLTQDLVDNNAAVAREAYGLAPVVTLGTRPETSLVAKTALEPVPYLTSAQFIGPTIRHRSSAALRDTGSWRTERPEITQEKCKRCFLCYLYCPDAAINLDADNFPHIDYDHCKGCMICYEECPTGAITRRPEV
jgi:pyruvate ferredoxin oxidoreductase gamma subunit